MSALSEADIGFAYEAQYTANVLAKPSTLDDWPLAEGDIRAVVFVAIIEAVRTVRRERGRIAEPWVKRQIELSTPAAVAELAFTWIDGRHPYESEIEPVVTSLRERGACARAHDLAQQLAKASARGKWTEVQKLQVELSKVRANADHERRIYTVAQAARAGLHPESNNATPMRFDSQLDRVVRLSPRTMLVLGAATNVGKTSILAKWLDHAEKEGEPAALVSVEDPEDLLGRKWLSIGTGLSATRMRDGELSDADMRMADATIDTWGGRRIWMEKIHDRKLESVLSSMRTLAAMGAKIIAVDYLQAIKCEGNWNRNKDKVDHILNELLACASTLGVAFILASQFSRQDIDSKSRIPTMRLLKESGDIENAATYVVLVWRMKEDSEAPVYCRVAKTKEGSGIGRTVAWKRDHESGVLVDYALPPKVASGREPPSAQDDGREF